MTGRDSSCAWRGTPTPTSRRSMRGAFRLGLGSDGCDISAVATLKREHGMDLRNDGGTFSNRGRDALGRARANIADREHAGVARLERKGRVAGRACVVGEVQARQHEALVVQRNAAPEPGGVGIRTDEEE